MMKGSASCEGLAGGQRSAYGRVKGAYGVIFRAWTGRGFGESKRGDRKSVV